MPPLRSAASLPVMVPPPQPPGQWSRVTVTLRTVPWGVAFSDIDEGDAAVAAFAGAPGRDLPVLVLSTRTDTPAHGVLLPNDVIIAANGTPLARMRLGDAMSLDTAGSGHVGGAFVRDHFRGVAASCRGT